MKLAEQIWRDEHARLSVGTYVCFSARHLALGKSSPLRTSQAARNYRSAPDRPREPDDELSIDRNVSDPPPLFVIECNLYAEWRAWRLGKATDIVQEKLAGLREGQRRHIIDVLDDHQSLADIVCLSRKRHVARLALADELRKWPTSDSLATMASFFEDFSGQERSELQRLFLADCGLDESSVARFSERLRVVAQTRDQWRQDLTDVASAAGVPSWERLWKHEGASIPAFSELAERIYRLVAADRCLLTDGKIRWSGEDKKHVKNRPATSADDKNLDDLCLRYVRRYEPPLIQAVGDVVAELLNAAFSNWLIAYDSNAVVQKIRDLRRSRAGH